MMPTKSAKTKRQRASRPKNKTGCGTCKIRHKRCDEAKPICANCRRTGRICDGYVDAETGAVVGGHPQQGIVSSLAWVVVRGVGHDPDTDAGVRLFRAGLGRQLALALRDDALVDAVVQLGQDDDDDDGGGDSGGPVRHAISALGFLGHRFEAYALSLPGHAAADALESRACRQYEQARRQGGAHSGPPHADQRLACCLLLALFAFLRGHDEPALAHLREAVQASTTTSSRSTVLHAALLMLDMALTLWLDRDRALSAVPLLPALSFARLYTSPQPTFGTDLATLGNELATISADILAFRHAVACRRGLSGPPPPSPLAPCPPPLSPIQDTIRSRLALWQQAWERVDPRSHPDMAYYQALFRCNWLGLRLTLEAIPVGDGARAGAPTTPGTLAALEEILRLAASTLQTRPPARYDPLCGEDAVAATGLLPLFSFRMSFIRPLCVVAGHAALEDAAGHAHARLLALRQNATRLLLARPWREGAWDSAALGRIAERRLQQAASP